MALELVQRAQRGANQKVQSSHWHFRHVRGFFFPPFFLKESASNVFSPRKYCCLLDCVLKPSPPAVMGISWESVTERQQSRKPEMSPCGGRWHASCITVRDVTSLIEINGEVAPGELGSHFHLAAHRS